MTITLELTKAETLALECMAGYAPQLGQDELRQILGDEPEQVRNAVQAVAKLRRAVVAQTPLNHDPDRRWVL